MRKKEKERTCKRCQKVWYVSLEAAKERKPTGLQQWGTRTYAHGAQMSFSSKSRTAGAVQLSQMEEKLARIARNNSCPNCGSQSYTERTVKV